MLYGVRPDEQLRLAAEGYTVRVYVPYGDQWYGYLMRRLAERPANLRLLRPRADLAASNPRSPSSERLIPLAMWTALPSLGWSRRAKW